MAKTDDDEARRLSSEINRWLAGKPKRRLSARQQAVRDRREALRRQIFGEQQ